jgi:hypothetical protein
MPYRGHVENGVIVFDEPAELDEGVVVSVVAHHTCHEAESHAAPRSWKGIFQGDGPVPSEEDIAQMRQEAWPNL